jgi:hypothetical protein
MSVRSSTASAPSFHDPRVAKALRRQGAVAALLSVVFIVGELTSSAGGSPQATASSGPLVVAEVPATIPAGGVHVGVLVLMPPANTDANTMDSNKAVDAANQYGHADAGMKPTAVLADVTIPGTIPPPDTDIKWRTIQDRLAWVVTFPFSERKDVDGFAATAYNVVVDADSGGFVWGFYTR